MGYYSDVALILSDKALAMLEKKLAAEKMELRCKVEQLLVGSDWVRHEDECTLYFWKRIKWYYTDRKEFPEVCYLHKFTKELDKLEKGPKGKGLYSYLIVALDTNHIHEAGLLDNPFNPYVHKEIRCERKIQS